MMPVRSRFAAARSARDPGSPLRSIFGTFLGLESWTRVVASHDVRASRARTARGRGSEAGWSSFGSARGLTYEGWRKSRKSTSRQQQTAIRKNLPKCDAHTGLNPMLWLRFSDSSRLGFPDARTENSVTASRAGLSLRSSIRPQARGGSSPQDAGAHRRAGSDCKSATVRGRSSSI